jgi:hypothetical protein
LPGLLNSRGGERVFLVMEASKGMPDRPECKELQASTAAGIYSSVDFEQNKSNRANSLSYVLGETIHCGIGVGT